MEFEKIAYIRKSEDDENDEDFVVYHEDKIYFNQKAEIEKIKQLYNGVGDIEYTLFPTSSSTEKTGDTIEGENQKFYHFFLDIDHTLTDDQSGEIDNRAIKAFDEMKGLGHVIHFATGRDHLDTCAQIEKFHVSQRSIAENGGIIKGLTTKPYHFGDISAPNEALTLLQERFGIDRIHVDKKQSDRLTEIVIEKIPDYSTEQIEQAIQYKAQVLASKRALHITKEGVDKGSALNYLSTEAPIPHDRIIAVGDSQLDAPMLRVAYLGIALKNSDEYAIDAAQIVLGGGKFFDGVLWVFNKFDPRFDYKQYGVRYKN